LVRFNGDGSGSAFFDLGSATCWFANRNGGVTVNFGAVAGGPNTTLGGRQASSGESSSNYIVGALNADATFAGTITNGGDEGGLNFTKVGTGNWTLSGSSSFIGNMTVQAGTLTISGSFNNGGLDFETQMGAAFALNGGTVSTENVQIDLGAVFTGYGTINGNLVNQGTTNLTGGGTLTVNGNFENDGTMTVSGSSILVVNLPTDGSGLFVNNGVLDIMDSPQTTLPMGFVNNKTILTSALVTIEQFSISATTCSVTIQSYTGHTYQLQKSASIVSPVWQNVGAPQAGTGAALVLKDTNATSTRTFYRVGVGP
jgi:autotransporter-associated beta strand protein